MIYEILKGQAVTNAADPGVNTTRNRDQDGIFQIEITGAAQATLQGRLAPSAPWMAINSYTVNAAEVVPIFPQMRVLLTSIASGVVNAWLDD